MANSSGSVQSVDRIVDLVEILSATPQGLPLSELAAAAGLHISTTHRLIGVLVDRGYACKDRESGRYRMTLRMFELGSRISAVLSVFSVAKPLLDALASATQEVVHLVERDRWEVVYLYRAESPSPKVRISSFVGCRNPMYCTGVGKSILAYLPDSEVVNIWENSRVCAYTDKTITDLDGLRAELERIRARGCAVDDEERETGVRCIAAPIFDWQDRPVAAMSVAAPVFRMSDSTMEWIRPRLLSAAREISTLLGRVEPPPEGVQRRKHNEITS